MKPKDDGEVRDSESTDDAPKDEDAKRAPADADEGVAASAPAESAPAESVPKRDEPGNEAPGAGSSEADAEEEEPSSRSPVSPSFDLREQSVLVAAPTDDDAEGGFLGRLGPRLLGVILILLVAAGGVGTVLTLVNPFRDWFMHLAMYAVIFSFFLLYLKAHGRRRAIIRFLMMLVTAALCGFFAWILSDYVPAQKVFLAHRVVTREEMPLLFVPIGLLLGSVLLLLFHCLVAARFARPEPE